MGTTMGTGNVHDDDAETLQFADESEWVDEDDEHEPHDDAYAPSIADEMNAADPADVAHRHNMVESAMTDECRFGCKVFRCSCGEEQVRHMASYGCRQG